jgi:hypothetical protein
MYPTNQKPITKEIMEFENKQEIKSVVFAGPRSSPGLEEAYDDPIPRSMLSLKGSPHPGVSEAWLALAAKKRHAYTFLEKAVKEMKDRAEQRDVKHDPGSTKPGGGERSMARTIKAFNALTGHNLTEEEGWEFMILLKLVRGRQGDFREDDYVDAAAYSGLLGECASSSR